MRTKEEADDYRYFPDPDLLPVHIDDATFDRIKAEMPELPVARRDRFMQEYALPEYDSRILTSYRSIADYFEAVVASVGTDNAKLAANWIMGDLLGALNKDEKTIEDSPISALQLAKLIERIKDNTLSGKLAKQAFTALFAGEGGTGDDAVDKIIADKGLKQETDTGAIKAIVEEVLAKNQAMVDEYKAGKEKAFNGLVGQVMKASKGKANPAQVNQLLKALIG
jgi:aspartyl-tRNA(Asn)/glutamyl-tRNA(Gln) amidotransferase subunit B